MRPTPARFAVILVLGALVGACGSSASPSPGAVASEPALTPASVAAVPRPTPSATAATPTATATAAATPVPPSASAALPIRGSARELSAANVYLAPSADGGVYVSIPVRKGPSRLVLLDATGRPRPGWPIAIKGTTECGPAMPVPDGTVRIVCGMKAFSFGADGRLMDGWPVDLHEGTTSGLAGDELVNVDERYLTDEDSGTVSHDAIVTAIAADGTALSSPPIGLFDRCCDREWAIGPDGIAYGVGRPTEGSNRTTVTALGTSGVVSEWNVDVAGSGSLPAFGPNEELILAFGSDARHSTRVAEISQSGEAITSAAVALRSVDLNSEGNTGDCSGSIGLPPAPLVSGDGTTILYSDLDTAMYRLDRSLAAARGWPFEPGVSPVTPTPGLETEHEAGYCPIPLAPVVGPDGTLVVALEAANPKVGGSLVAVGADGRVRAGWPVGLKRPGSAFWAMAAGPDGTTYALAIEPESGGKSSGTVLAIAPHSTVLWSTTIVEP
ncbi:MAG: hypothetical protein ACJ779_10030 [Chloroflexota bacterium]